MPRWNLEALTSNQDEFDFAKFKRLLVAYAKENTALVTSFLSTPFTQIIGVDEDTSVIDAISSVGGLMGLFMGFTMVTLAEIIYYTSSLLITSIFGIKNQVKNNLRSLLEQVEMGKRDRRLLGSIGVDKNGHFPGKF